MRFHNHAEKNKKTTKECLVTNAKSALLKATTIQEPCKMESKVATNRQHEKNNVQKALHCKSL